MILPHIAVAATVSALNPQAQLLAQSLQLSSVDINVTAYPFLLVYTESYLEIRPINQPDLGPVHIDFLNGKLGYRRRHSFIKDELLAKAIGVRGNTTLKVVDATAGLGRDSFMLACLGCDVKMLERSPIMAALLQDGLERLLEVSTPQQKLMLELLHTDACAYLSGLQEVDFPDVIYLDPMYPHRSKTALVKKEMRIIRAVVGDDEDAGKILTNALRRVKKRTVVKRSRSASFLNLQKPDIIYQSKQHRFDVYLAK